MRDGNTSFMVGGDDSISADLSNDEFSIAARSVGQCPKPCLIERGAIGVNFLARFYSSAVWEGDCNSCCDPERALRNLSFTANLPQNTPNHRLKRLYEKAWARLLTDSETPYIGPVCKAIVRMYERSTGTELTLTALPTLAKEEVGWWATNQHEEGFFPNVGAADFGLAVLTWKNTFIQDENILQQVLIKIADGKLSEIPAFSLVSPANATEPVRVNGNMQEENEISPSPSPGGKPAAEVSAPTPEKAKKGKAKPKTGKEPSKRTPSKSTETAGTPEPKEPAKPKPQAKVKAKAKTKPKAKAKAAPKADRVPEPAPKAAGRKANKPSASNSA